MVLLGCYLKRPGHFPEPGVSVYALNLTSQALHNRALRVLSPEAKEIVSFYWPI